VTGVQTCALPISLTLKVSKDEYLFGVQAVDKEGNASLVTFPRPAGR